MREDEGLGLSWDDVPDSRTSQETAPVPEGQHVVDVVVVTTSTKITKRGTKPMMTVEGEEGWRAHGSNKTEAKPGDRLRLSAKFKRSISDQSFGFFSYSYVCDIELPETPSSESQEQAAE